MQSPLAPTRGVQAFVDRSAGEPVFDPSLHLKIGAPSAVTLLPNFETIQGGGGVGSGNSAAAPLVETDVSTGHPTQPSRLGYTTAMPILSPAGVAAMRSIIAINSDMIRGNERAPRHLRGLPYASNFVRELAQSPALLNHVSHLAGMQLVPHYMIGSAAHTNLSQDLDKYQALVNLKQSVDAWHVDSCPFVLIVVVSEQDGMQGGELQVVKAVGLPAARKAVAAGISDDDLLSVKYVRPGYGILMQGSQLLHRVSAVLKGPKGPRISVVFSFMPASTLHLPDTTAIGSWLRGIDGKSHYPEAAFEYFRGRAHRAEQQLHHYVNRERFTEDRGKLAAKLRRTAEELRDAAEDLQTGGTHLGWISDREHDEGEKNKKKKTRSKL